MKRLAPGGFVMRTLRQTCRASALTVFLAAGGGLSIGASALAAGNAVRGAAPTFSRDVAPILDAHCSTCHRAGGDAPFSLSTYAEARQRARLIARVTRDGLMPPWRAATDAGGFVGLDPLSNDEIRTLEAWAQEGAKERERTDRPLPPPHRDGWQLGSPDLVVTFPEPFVLDADGGDRYRTFAVPVPIEHRRFVRGIEFRPGAAAGIVHHANILLDPTARTRALDAEDPLPGYAGAVARSAANPDGFLLGYAPGLAEPLAAEGDAWELAPGVDLVVQLHLSPSGRTERVQPSIALYFTDVPPRMPPVLMRLGSRRLEIPAGETRYRASDSYVLPVGVDLLSIKPHAHYLARTVEVTATLPGGRVRQLLSVPAWDFRWQNTYRFRTPVSLPTGTRVTIEFVFDNSDDNPANRSHPPRAVAWGPASSDEMADVWIQARTVDDGERRLLAGDVGRKTAFEELEGYKRLLAREPGDLVLNDDIALLYLELGLPAEAATHFERTVAAHSESADAHVRLSVALSAVGDVDRAIAELETAIRLRPAFPIAHNNLGNLYAMRGRPAEAAAQYEWALRSDPRYARGHNGLATLAMHAGRLDEALAHLREAVALDPALDEARRNLGLVLHARGELIDAAGAFREALRLDPESAPTRIAYAWLVATAADPAVRDGTLAAALLGDRLSTRGPADARTLAVVAAVLAEHGQTPAARAAVAAALNAPDATPALRLLLHQQEVELDRNRRFLAHGPLP